MPSDTTIEDDTSQLTDPEDYHRTQRLKEIHQARQRVHKVSQNLQHMAPDTEHKNHRFKLAIAVSNYYAEVEPLLNATDRTIELPSDAPWDTAAEFADSLGLNDKNSATTKGNLTVFREINKFLASIRPLIEDGDNEADSDYSDLL